MVELQHHPFGIQNENSQSFERFFSRTRPCRAKRVVHFQLERSSREQVLISGESLVELVKLSAELQRGAEGVQRVEAHHPALSRSVLHQRTES